MCFTIVINRDIPIYKPNMHSSGYQMAYDTASSRLTKSDLALGYKAPDFELYSAVSNGSDYSGSIHHKVSPALETAVHFAWTHDKDATAAPSFAIGAKYQIDKDSSLAAKINQSSALGLSYSQVHCIPVRCFDYRLPVNL